MSLVTPKQLAKTLNLIADSEIDSAQYQRLLESGCFSELLRKFMRTAEPFGDTYTVTVDYDMSLKAMIGAGRYDWVNEDITAERFPVNKRKSGEVELYVLHFGRGMTTKEVLAELDRHGLRPAELPELLALGTANPDLQREYSLVALGSEWQDPCDGVNVPILGERGCGRDLNLGWNDPRSQWSDHCRFVAVRK